MSTERTESVVKEMLQKEGKFKQTNLVVVLTGLMETGKTTLLHPLFGKDLPDRYNSTGIAERSLRGLTQYLCSADKELRLVENPQDMFELVARVKMVPSVRSIDHLLKSADTAPPWPLILDKFSWSNVTRCVKVLTLQGFYVVA